MFSFLRVQGRHLQGASAASSSLRRSVVAVAQLRTSPLSAGFSTKQAASNAGNKPKHGLGRGGKGVATRGGGDPGAIWLRIDGFSMFSSRYDLDNAVQNSGIQILDAERELEKANLYPTGSFIIQAQLKSGSSKESKGANQQTAYESLRRHLMAKFNRRITVQELTGNNRKNIITGAQYGIDDCTLRIRNASSYVGVEELKFLFRDYAMARETPFERLQLNRQSRHDAGPPGGGGGGGGNFANSYNWFVRFTSKSEAERAYMSLEMSAVQGRTLQMFLYS